jgi:TolB-like protein
MESERRLASIVSLDVAGYSARTEADEAGTIAAIAALRNTVERIAREHAGRIFNTAGDGFMLEFGSSSAAMGAAFALAETCEPKVRVGVHLGEVAVQPNGDLLGHGVNVAARLMAQAGPGSALVSSAVRQTLRGPLAARLVSRGMLHLDKMNETIEGFVIVAAAAESVVATGATAKKEPLLAVLPFDNLSADQEMQFFSDGVSEEILQRLVRGTKLRVIGRTSSFQFRGADKSATKVASQLRATHILDGSIRRSASRVRVAAQLVDAESLTTLWSDRYDRTLEDIFAVQDEIAEAIAKELDRAISGDTKAVDPLAYDLYLRANQAFWFEGEKGLQAIRLLEEAVQLDPSFTLARGRLAGALGIAYHYQPYAQRETFAKRVREQIRLTLVQDPNNVDALSAELFLRPPIGELRDVELQMMRVRQTSPAHYSIGFILLNVGRLREAVEISRQNFENDPLNATAAMVYGLSMYIAGQTALSRSLFENVLKRWPDQHQAAIDLVILGVAAKDWALVDAIMEPERLKKYPLREFEPFARQYTSMMRDPSPSAKLRPLELMQRSMEKTGHVDFWWLAAAASLGFGDEAYEIAASAKFGPAGASDDVLGVDAYRTTVLFYQEFARLRQDRRFVELCARLGLVEYWMTSGHWPDCVDEVAPHYDFKAECARVAAGPPLPLAT